MFYLDLFGSLNRATVEYVLVGGLALNLHGIERATLDVDLVVALEPGNLNRAIDVFRDLGLKPVAPVALDDARDPANLARWRDEKRMIAFGVRNPTAHTPTVDLLVHSPVPISTLLAGAVRKNLGGVEIPVAGIDDLIAMKTASGRTIDLADVRALNKLKQLQRSKP